MVQICGRKKKKVVVVVDEPQIMAWKEKWHNSRVRTVEKYPSVYSR